MRSRAGLTWALALVLSMTVGSGCRRVLSPDADAVPESLEFFDGVVEVRWPNQVVDRAITLEYSNHPFVSFESPLRVREHVPVDVSGPVRLSRVPDTPFLLEFRWRDTKGRSMQWSFGPVELARRTVAIDLQKPNHRVRPLLLVGGRPETPLWTSVSGQSPQIGSSYAYGSSETDSIAEFHVPDPLPSYRFEWRFEEAPVGLQSVKATLADTLVGPSVHPARLEADELILRVHSKLGVFQDAASWIRVTSQGEGRWHEVASSSRFVPETAISIPVLAGVVEVDLDVPSAMRGFSMGRVFITSVGAADTLDVDVASVEVDARVLARSGDPLAYRNVIVREAGADFRSSVTRDTDATGSFQLLLHPGRFYVEVEDAWTQLIQVSRDTTLTLREPTP